MIVWFLLAALTPGLGVPLEVVSVVETSEPQTLPLGASIAGMVRAGHWAHFATKADNDDESIEFEVVAHSPLPTAIGVYAADGLAHQVSAQGTLQPTADLLGGQAIDSDTVSRIGNSTHRHFHVYISQCYMLVGSQYVVSIHGSSGIDVPFTVLAHRRKAKLVGAEVADKVCDGKYAHHFWELPTVPHKGGVEVTVRKTSGELEAFYVRHERCAGPSGANIAERGLMGHGLSQGSVTLPSLDHELLAGRYYVSIRGSVDMCGSYSISLRNLTQSQLISTSSS